MTRELEHPAPEQITLTGVLHALSDPTRLAVVRQIADGGERQCGSFDVKVAKSTLSQHFRVLREAGVIWTRAEGSQRYVSLRREELQKLFPGLLDAVLRSARRSRKPR